METQPHNDKGNPVFLRLKRDMYEQLAALKRQAGVRGVATIAKLIIAAVLREGITISHQPRAARNRKCTAA